MRRKRHDITYGTYTNIGTWDRLFVQAGLDGDKIWASVFEIAVNIDIS